MSTREHRRSPRRKVSETILVSDVMTDEVAGRIGNLSEGGMLLIANVPLNDDALYQFRFRLGGADAPEIEVGAHLLWAEQARSAGQTWGGFRFIAMSDAHRDRLNAWVDAPDAQYD